MHEKGILGDGGNGGLRWMSCIFLSCDNIFGHLVTWVLQTNPHQQSSNFFYITNPVGRKMNKNNLTPFVFLYLIKTGTSRERVETFTSGCFWTGSCGEWLMGQVFFDSEASRECSPVPSPQPTLLLFLFLLESLARLRPFRLCSSSSIWERAHGYN